MIYKTEDVINAHKYSSNHKLELIKDDFCGCFFCLKIFNPIEISEWLAEKDGTAICPYCCTDSVIGKYSGFPIEKEFLEEMKKILVFLEV